MPHHMNLDRIREHMPVLGSDGQHVGKVDKIEGQRIKLTRDSGGGEHHFIDAGQIADVTDDAVQLNQAAAQVRRGWQGEGPTAGPAAMVGATQGQRSLMGAAGAGNGQSGAGMAAGIKPGG